VLCETVVSLIPLVGFILTNNYDLLVFRMPVVGVRNIGCRSPLLSCGINSTTTCFERW
jgi:hypothetical protein